MPRHDFTSPRLFVDAALASGDPVRLEREQANYLLNVLRLGEGAEVLVFNGRDGEWQARVKLETRRGGDLVPVAQTRPQSPTNPLTYAFAPLKHARLDYLVQKAVEMGAGRLQPVITRRTQSSRINRERMRANVIEAAEQCGVLAVPDVADELRFDAWLAGLDPEILVIFCDEDAPTSDPVEALVAMRPHATGRPLSLIIGPEGGFDPAERAALLARPNQVRLALGPRILRADTAAVAALAVVQAVLGDWRG